MVMNNATRLYQIQNARIARLQRITVGGKPKSWQPDSLLWLAFRKLRSFSGAGHFVLEVCLGFKWYQKIISMKAIKRGKKAIVIGNGPSKGFVEPDVLKKLQESGVEIFAVNFWTEDTLLSEIVPNYLTISDPATLGADCGGHFSSKNSKLRDYVISNPSMKIIAPLRRCDLLSTEFGSGRVIGFCDSEMRMLTKNVSPILPRGYVSMTLFKALALALWFEYETIYVIGMDNTYPRNIFCDRNNKFLNYETHSGEEDFVSDLSNIYKTISDGLFNIGIIFYDLRKFAKGNIINLDEASLTDAFKKISYAEFKNKEIM